MRVAWAEVLKGQARRRARYLRAVVVHGVSGPADRASDAGGPLGGSGGRRYTARRRSGPHWN